MNHTLGNYSERSNVSSDTLFHFTNSYNIIESILDPDTGGFKFSLIYEKIPGTKLAYFVPSISFCDIPLSLIRHHVNWYGAYAIGVKRSVFKSKGATPVFYCHSKSPLIPHNSKKKSVQFYTDMIWFTTRIKQVYGTQAIGDPIQLKRRKFYNEREWRIVDTHNQNFSIEKYQREDDLQYHLREYRWNVPSNIQFSVDDIDYIILEKTSDLPRFIEFVKNKYPQKEAEILSRVLFYQKLHKDL